MSKSNNPDHLHPDECDVIVGYCPRTDRCFATNITAGRSVYVLNPSQWLLSLDDVFGTGPGNEFRTGPANAPVTQPKDWRPESGDLEIHS